MTSNAMTFVSAKTFTPSGGRKKECLIENKLVMIMLANGADDEEGTATFSIGRVAQNASMQPEMVHGTLMHLERDGHISGFDHITTENWLGAIQTVTIVGLKEWGRS